MICAAFGSLPRAAQADDPPQFTDVAGESGLRFRHEFGAKRVENLLQTTGAGCAFLDYDNDGWLDAFMVNGTTLDESGAPVAAGAKRHGLFHNDGDGTFSRVTQTAGLGESTYGQGCACADYDGDGWTDIYVTNYGPNRLYRNRGDGTFEDVSAKAGVADPRWSTGAVFFDHDGDGDLDLFVANYVRYRVGSKSVHASALSKRSGYIRFPGPRDYEADGDVLYRNNGDGTFADVTVDAGVTARGKGLGVIASDLDSDGDQDLFVANDASPNFLYRNDGGHFVEVAVRAGVAFDTEGRDTAAMGVDVADVDSDGKPDIFVTNMIGEFNNLYRNAGRLSFEDVTRRTGLSDDNYRYVGWGTRLVDFDNDGLLDCFVANGHFVDDVQARSQSVTYGQRNMLFLGTEQGTFRNVTGDCGEHVQRKRVGRGAAVGDYDRDGDLDILLLNSGGRCELLRNDLPQNDRWCQVRLRGKSPNTQALGAVVTITFGKRSRRTEVRAAGSYLSSSDPTVHVGLARGPAKGTATVAWPSGKRSRHAVTAGSVVVIEEPE